MNDLDKKITKILSSNFNIPNNYYEMIDTTLENLPPQKITNNKFKYLKLSVATTCCSLILITGVVFAKDIENYFKNLFTCSTDAIDNAVANGYVQNIDMNYIYDKDIGIKVDNLILDDLNLDVSFCFETQDENIDSISLNKYTILNDNNELIYECGETVKVGLAYSMGQNFEKSQTKVTNTTFKDSILFGLRENQNDFNSLNFKIKSLKLTYVDNSSEIIDGDWEFTIALSKQMKESENFYYSMLEENEYVESCKATLSATGMKIEINLKTPMVKGNSPEEDDEIIFRDWLNTDYFSLKSNNKTFKVTEINLVDATKIVLVYDNIGKFFDNIDTFTLYIKAYDTTIVLTKDSI